MALYRRVLTRSRWPQVAMQFHFSALTPFLTPKSNPSGPTSKNFRLRRAEGACGTAPAGRQVPPGTLPKVRVLVQYTQYLGPGGRGHIF